ncbi:MAG: hypothetical protein ACOCU0_03650 [Bacillota bacterium]
MNNLHEKRGPESVRLGYDGMKRIGEISDEKLAIMGPHNEKNAFIRPTKS